MSTTIAGAGVPSVKAPIPRQIRYIIGNEGCERFSFYGMGNILTVARRYRVVDHYRKASGPSTAPGPK